MINKDQITSISIEALKEWGYIYLYHIQDGFDNYRHQIVEGTRDQLDTFLRQLVEKNGEENTCFDFYYGRLSEEEKKRVLMTLGDGEREFLKARQWSEEEVIFAYHPLLFQIAFSLSVEEILFSTFYFSKEPCTVWGNYEKKFVMFDTGNSEVDNK